MKRAFAGYEESRRWCPSSVAERFDTVRRDWTHEKVEIFQQCVESGMQE
jgi:hypothetical protein